MPISFVLSHLEIKLPAGEQSGTCLSEDQDVPDQSLWLEGWARPPIPVTVDLTALFTQAGHTCFMEI